jgi:hypothetical protein
MPQTLGDRTQYVAYKLGNRSDLLQPISSIPIAGVITGVAINAPGGGYQVNDILTLEQSGAFNGWIMITGVTSPQGGVTSLVVIQNGQGYTAGAANAGGGNGTGATFNLTVGTAPQPSRIDIWLRDAYINLFMENRFPGSEATVSFNTVQGVGAYNYPDTVRAIEALTLFRSDGTIITVETKDIKYLRRMNSLNQAAPSMWAEYGYSINFRPIPDNNGPYLCVLDCWMKPIITTPISETPCLLPIDWLEALDYGATSRGHTDIQEEDKAHAIQSLLYGFVDPQTGKYTPGLIQNLQNRIQASAPFKDWGMQPKGQTQSYTKRR